ncbi:hypothetical protein SK128_002738, partial [Halocaridina rubra]
MLSFGAFEPPSSRTLVISFLLEKDDCSEDPLPNRRESEEGQSKNSTKSGLTKNLNCRVSVKCMCGDYWVKSLSVSDIGRDLSKLTEYTLKYSVHRYPSKSSSLTAGKHIKIGRQKESEAVCKWHDQQKACGIKVSPSAIRNAFQQLIRHL